jgi:hypothetical protein
MARYLAARPRRCRARTVEFAFATAHLYQHLVSTRVREGGAEQLAEQLDRDYARGRVAAVLVLEHFGAREYEAVSRGDAPGRVLRRTARHEPVLIGVSDSDALVRAVLRRVKGHDLRRHILLKGADAAVPERAPPNCSFGGEGTPFNRHLLPTVGAIAAPWILFNPPFGLESIDFELMRRQTLAFTGLTLDLERMSAREIAGRVDDHRRRRSAGAETCEA